MMDAPGGWRILIVDDSRDDAELTEIALREAGLRFVARRASTAQDMDEALAAFSPQLVISDLNLPGFSGEEARALARAHDPALPFVFLTGALYAPEPPPDADVPLLTKDALGELPDLLRGLLPEAE
ncbi:response regulator [Luteimonas huabeiensis]|uniref:response regulator n=1 Tax=Luteimonas huabeiensis TaxID=1244513 RepID=UPI00046695D5|nr:response regulator [Luteimonas huabeiensis]